MALLVAVYHLDPGRVFDLPQWVLAILLRQLPYIQSLGMLEMAVATTLPHMKKDEARSTIRRLQRKVEEQQQIEPMEILEFDPDKAAEWFAAQGLKVESNGSSQL